MGLGRARILRNPELSAAISGRTVTLEQLLNLGDPQQRASYLALWPTGKMPLLVDRGRPVPETSIIIEYMPPSVPVCDTVHVPSTSARRIVWAPWLSYFSFSL